MMQKASTIQVRRILMIQLVATVALSVTLLVLGTVYVWSGLTGGLIATLANAYFAWKVFAKQQESEPEQILATYYRAEVSKIILTVMLFAGAIVIIKPLNMIPLIGVYLVNTMIPWLVSYFDDDSKTWRLKNGR
ncbi:MAG: ATP synthase subunit I [Gammaproteobacteria bacterium]|nr:ATP synthase subunit I [Gammaproteobacteria bacterium]MDH5735885.1 ATP synthase subunit I [Gammaproteobacteria bacterium]